MQNVDYLEMELIKSEKKRILDLSFNLSRGFFAVSIFGIMLSHLFYPLIGNVLHIIDIAYIIYSLYFVIIQKKKENYINICIYTEITMIYLLYIFILAAFYLGFEAYMSKMIPNKYLIVIPILVIVLLSLIAAPLYIRHLIRNKSYKKGKLIGFSITGFVLLGMGLGKLTRSNVVSWMFILICYFIISVLAIYVYYYLYLIKLFKKYNVISKDQA